MPYKRSNRGSGYRVHRVTQASNVTRANLRLPT